MAEKPAVLVVEDEEDIRELVRNALEAEGYRVLEAASREAFDQLDGLEKIAVFVLDVGLPDGNGLEIVREIRRRPGSAGIVMLTGRADETDQVIGLELGADDYIAKPFRVREFRARVNSVYRRSIEAGSGKRSAGENPDGDHGDELLEFHGIRMMPAARSLSGPDGTPIELTTMEFDVLKVLVENRNRVLSRDQIMDRVHGTDWAVYDRTVDGIISRIRHKLYPGGDGGSRIKTVRGVGYMLSDG